MCEHYSTLFESIRDVDGMGAGVDAALLSTTLIETAENASVTISEITSKRNLRIG